MTPKPQVESHGYKQLSHPLWEEVFLSSLLGHVCQSPGCGTDHGRKQQHGRLFCSTLLSGSLNRTSISSMDGGILWDPQKLLLTGMKAYCENTKSFLHGTDAAVHHISFLDALRHPRRTSPFLGTPVRGSGIYLLSYGGQALGGWHSRSCSLNPHRLEVWR